MADPVQFVHCRNPDCKPQMECRKPALDMMGGQRIRSARQKPACRRCGSDAVDIARKICYACCSESNPGPHEIRIKTMCYECKSTSVRPMLDFTVCQEEDECMICCEDMEEGDVQAIYQPCGHTCCPECFVQSMDTRINANKIVANPATGAHTLSCIVDGCPSLLKSNHSVKLTSERSRDMFQRFSAVHLVRKALHGEICPFPDCNDALIELPDEKDALVVTCLSCERRFCRHCQKESITGKCPAVEDKDAVREMLKSGITPCPNCKVPIFRSKGCNRVYCTSCKKNFCWICHKLTGGEGQSTAIKYAHWRAADRENDCPLWGGEADIDALEAAAAEGGGGGGAAAGELP